jgi:hypothetical protein
MAIIKKRFKLSKFGTRLTRNRFRIESDSFPLRRKESESLDHDFAGIVPRLVAAPSETITKAMRPPRFSNLLGRAEFTRRPRASKRSILKGYNRE